MKNRRFILVITLIFLIVGSNITTYFATKKVMINKESVKDEKSNYAVTYGSIFKFDKYAYYPQIRNFYDEALEKKINNNLDKTFSEWLPEKIYYARLSGVRTRMSTDKYLSIEIIYIWESGRRAYNSICNMVNMETGEIMYLNELMEVDEELTALLLTEGNLKVDYDIGTGEYDAAYTKEDLEGKDPKEILGQLEKCSEPYNEDNWSGKPTFYIEKGRIYFLGIFNRESKVYIELDKIEDKLKVPKW